MVNSPWGPLQCRENITTDVTRFYGSERKTDIQKEKLCQSHDFVSLGGQIFVTLQIEYASSVRKYRRLPKKIHTMLSRIRDT